MTIEEILKENRSCRWYISPEGWILSTLEEACGWLVDPKRKTVMWTGHFGIELDQNLYPLSSKMELLRRSDF